MARLRGPGGCPWDREQNYDTIKPFLLEETYEVVDAISRRDWEELANELGDLLLQVVFFAQMAAEDGHFTIEDVIERIYTKMVRRHPHVFGESKADTAADVLRNWEVLKAEEKRQNQSEQGKTFEPPKSVLAGVSSSVPALMQAYQLTSRAAHVGFDWKKLEDVLEKLREEAAELETEAMTGNILSPDDKHASADAHAKVEDEAGDLLFTAVNVARFLKVDPESALRKTNQKFRRRFEWIEQELRKIGKSPREASLEEMDSLWNRSKEIEQEIGL